MSRDPSGNLPILVLSSVLSVGSTGIGFWTAVLPGLSGPAAGRVLVPVLLAAVLWIIGLGSALAGNTRNGSIAVIFGFFPLLGAITAAITAII